MIYLLLSILSSSAIYTVFKIIDRRNIDLLLSVVVNYFTAASLGYALSPLEVELNTILNYKWMWLPLLVGSLYVCMFLFIGYSTKRVGITKTSVATRLSMVIPIVVSMAFYEQYIDFFNIVLLLFSVVIVVMATLPKSKNSSSGSSFSIILPIILFIGSGSIDALVKIAQASFVPDSEIKIFTGMLFSVSFIISFCILIIRHKSTASNRFESICLGVLLGSVNYGSLYFMMRALTYSGINSSNVFAINNIGVVLLSIGIGMFLFDEKLSKINKIGVTLASAIILLLL